MKQISKLSLLRGKNIPLTDKVELIHPKLKDIDDNDMDSDKYRLYVSLLTCGRIEYADILWCESKIWYEDIESDWKLFLNMSFNQSNSIKVKLENYDSIIEGASISPIYRDALNFFLGLSGEYIISMVENGGVQQTVLHNAHINDDGVYVLSKDNIIITEMIYNLIAQNLRKINWINRDYMFLKGGNKAAKKYILKHDYNERQVHRKQYITFEDIISFLMCKTNNPLVVWELPIYTIYNMYFRYNKINEYQDVLNKLNSGCIDTKKNPINWEKINWASSID